MALEDGKIVEGLWQRREEALAACREKYGPLCTAIARNILGSREDAEECAGDTWLRAWQAIPPQRPRDLGAFLSRITRNLALNRLEARRAQKRGGGQGELALEELLECLPGGESPEGAAQAAELEGAVNRFLAALDRRSRVIFLRRYWYLEPLGDIARALGVTVGGVKASLHRTRKKLRAHLEQEGFLP